MIGALVAASRSAALARLAASASSSPASRSSAGSRSSARACSADRAGSAPARGDPAAPRRQALRRGPSRPRSPKPPCRTCSRRSTQTCAWSRPSRARTSTSSRCRGTGPSSSDAGRPCRTRRTTPMGDAIASGDPVETHGRHRDRRDARLGGRATSWSSSGMGVVARAPAARGDRLDRRRVPRATVLSSAERELLEAICEELSQALDRAALFEAERDARHRAELMEQNAAHLAAASTAIDVARSTVDRPRGLRGRRRVRVEAPRRSRRSKRSPPPTSLPQTQRLFAEYPIDRAGLVTESLRSGALTTAATGEEFDAPVPEARGGAASARFRDRRRRPASSRDRRRGGRGVRSARGADAG